MQEWIMTGYEVLAVLLLGGRCSLCARACFLVVQAERRRNVKWTALSGFSVSLVIELSQLLNNRRPDVDDLLMNALGTALGGAIYICARKIEGHDQTRPPIYALLTCTW